MFFTHMCNSFKYLAVTNILLFVISAPQPDTLLHPRSFFEKHKTRFAVFSRSSTATGVAVLGFRDATAIEQGHEFWGARSGPGAGPGSVVTTAAGAFERGGERGIAGAGAEHVPRAVAPLERNAQNACAGIALPPRPGRSFDCPF